MSLPPQREGSARQRSADEAWPLQTVRERAAQALNASVIRSERADAARIKAAPDKLPVAASGGPRTGRTRSSQQLTSTTPDAAVSDAAERRAGSLVDTAEIPGGGELRLLRHGPHYEIMFGSEQLMGSWSYRSEQALATLALGGLGKEPKVLIGGLGMGFTLAAARATLPMGASIIVAELVPKIVVWAGGHLRHLFGGSLDDPRVSVEVADVHDLILAHPAGFDAILLDVDNGPDGLISLANERLYSAWGLRAARSALRPGGVLAIWSAYPDDSFAHRLRFAGFDVEEVSIDTDRSENNPDHTVWLATVAQQVNGSSGLGSVRVGAED